MKFDADLARKILLAVEADPRATGIWLVNLEDALPDVDDQVISYHAMILGDAGLLEGEMLPGDGRLCWGVRRLTASGHEFLDKARSQTLWEKAKAITLEKTGGIALDVLKAVLTSVGMKAVGL